MSSCSVELGVQLMIYLRGGGFRQGTVVSFFSDSVMFCVLNALVFASGYVQVATASCLLTLTKQGKI